MSRFTLIEEPPAAAPRRFTLVQEQQPDPTLAERVLASPVGAALKGASSIVEGGAELLPHVLSTVTSAGGTMPNAVSDWLAEESRRVRAINAQNEAAYQQARSRTGREGMDAGRLVGELGSGVALGMVVPGATVPTSVTGRAAYGAAVGAGSGALAPTREVDDQRFLEQKAAQMGAGAVAGGVATPVVGAIVDRVVPLVDRLVGRWMGGPKMSETMLTERIRFELGRADIDFGTLPEAARKQIVKEVSEALQKGKRLDAAALSRKLDLDAFGGGTQGQITRDPAQWNREFNLRQIENAGEPLVNQVRAVREATGQRLSQLGADVPGDAADRGRAVMESLQRADAPLKGAVDDAYRAARGAAGRQSRLQPWQFAQTANDALDEGQLGAVLPGEVRRVMNQVATGDIPLTVDTASQIQSLLSAQARMLRQAGNREGAKAVDMVSDALRATDLEAGAPDAARKAFDSAKRLAAVRFQLQKAAPAYKAAVDALSDPLEFPPEKFLNQYVLRASADTVKNLAGVLPQDGADAVRSHIAKHLQEAAFGQNIAGDGPMAVERYTKALNALGRKKLAAFFPEEAVDELYRISRVNAYVSQQPAGITPNRSGTAGALFNLLQRIQGVPVAVPVIRGMVNQSRATSALSPQVPSEAIPVLTPALRDRLPLVPAAGGVVAAQ